LGIDVVKLNISSDITNNTNNESFENYDDHLPRASLRVDKNYTIDFGGADTCNGFVFDNTSTKYYMAARINSTIYLLKYDINGTQIWNSTWDGPDTEYVGDLDIDSHGNIYVVGSTYSWSMGQTDVIIIKFLPNGSIAWNITWGGTHFDDGNDITIDDNDDIYVAADSRSFVGTNQEGYLLKYNSSGDQQWSKSYYGADSNGAYGKGVGFGNGRIYFVGYFYYGMWSDYWAYIDAYYPNGTKDWSDMYGGFDENYYYFEVAAKNGDVYVSGNYRAFQSSDFQFLLVKYDSTPSRAWNKKWNTPYEDRSTSVTIGHDDQVYIVGWSKNNSAGGTFDTIVLKYDTAGNLQWQMEIGGADNDSPKRILYNSNTSQYYLVGSSLSWGTGTYDIYVMTFNLHPGTFSLTSDATDPDTDGQFNLFWTTSHDADNYSLYVCSQYITEINETTTEIVTQQQTLSHNPNLGVSDVYYYLVIAFNEYENTSSNCIDVNVTVLLPPSDFTLSSTADSPDDDGAFYLNWTLSQYAENYTLYQHNSLIITFNQTLTMLKNQTNDLSYSMIALTNGTYYFVVESKNMQGTNRTENLIIIVAIPPPQSNPPLSPPSDGTINGPIIISPALLEKVN